MTWNYRIVHYRKGGFGLHEVYYDDNGRPAGMTKEPWSFACDDDEGPQGIALSLKQALSDAENRAVLLEPEEWSGFETTEGGDE